MIYESSGWLRFSSNTVKEAKKPETQNHRWNLQSTTFLFICLHICFWFAQDCVAYAVNSDSYIDSFISMLSSSSNQIGKFFVLSSGPEALLPHFPSFSLHGTVVNKGNQKQDMGHYLYSQSDFT